MCESVCFLSRSALCVAVRCSLQPHSLKELIHASEAKRPALRRLTLLWAFCPAPQRVLGKWGCAQPNISPHVCSLAALFFGIIPNGRKLPGSRTSLSMYIYFFY